MFCVTLNLSDILTETPYREKLIWTVIILQKASPFVIILTATYTAFLNKIQRIIKIYCKSILWRYINIGNRTEGEGHTKFRSDGYNKKTFYKTQVVLEALQAGVSVFFVDSDCFFLKNPLPYLKNFRDCNLATTQELNGTVHNSGIYLAHPTPATIELHEEMIRNQEKKSNRSNQQILNDIITQQIENNNLKITKLGENKFYTGGREYFYQGHLYHCCSFPYDECCPRSEAIIQHNNIAFTLGVKIYRFKEQLMWEVDTNRLVWISLFLQTETRSNKNN